MAFQINVSGIEGELNRRLENLEVLRKEIIPGLAEAMKGTPAYDADVTATDLGKYFRIGYRRIGTPAKAIVAVRFPEGRGDDYTIYLKAADGVMNARSVVSSRADLIPTIKGILFDMGMESREAKGWQQSYTAWQMHAIDAEEALKKNLYQFVDKRGASIPELTTNCLVSADLKGNKSAAALYWKSTPIVTFEFEGRSKYRTIWNCLGNKTEEGHLNLATYTADNPSEELIDSLWPEIKGHIETLYLDESN